MSELDEVFIRLWLAHFIITACGCYVGCQLAYRVIDAVALWAVLRIKPSWTRERALAELKKARE